MRMSGVFSVASHTIKLASNKEPIILAPFGDVHFGSSHHCVERFKKFCDRYRRKKNVYFLGMGDYFDFLSAKERNSLKKADLHDETILALEQRTDTKTREFAKKIEFMRGRCLGLLDGKHWYEYRNGDTSTHQLASHLQTEFLGTMAFVHLDIDWQGRRGGIDIIAHHGKGRGQLAGSTFNTVEKMGQIFPTADICLMGHDHKRGSIPGRVTLLPHHNHKTGQLEMKEKLQHYGRTGSFLTAYKPGESSYVVEACLPPASLGGIEYWLTPTCAGGRLNIQIQEVA